MSDLDEALATYEKWGATFIDDAAISAPIVAAARNWQTLTNPSDELLDRVADLAGERNGFWQIPPVAAAYIAAVVDALTVTAEPDD